MISYIFGGFIIVGVIYGILNGYNMSSEMFNAAIDSIELVFKMLPVTALWMGIVRIADASGLLDKLASFFTPLIRFIFPDIPKGSICLKYISTNIMMNVIGAYNAATPMGLEAMGELEKINLNKGVASRSMITLILINTFTITIVPTSIISLRILNNSSNPSGIVPYIIIGSIIINISCILIDKMYYVIRRRK